MQRIPTLGQAARGGAESAYDRRRREESETRKLYGSRQWKALRLAQLDASPPCVMCESAGRLTAATVCDHVHAHRGDVARFWAGPFQSLCKRCHDSAKQAEEGDRFNLHPAWLRRSLAPLTLVCGPAGAGKTTYVRERAGAGDLVLDLDVLIEEAKREGETRIATLPRAIRLRNERIGDLGREGAAEKWPAAWLIVSEPRPDHRQWWVDQVGAREVVVLATAVGVCAQRIAARDGGSRIAARRLPEQWWRDYRPRSGDVVRRG